MFGEFRSISNRTGTDSKIHKYRSTLSGCTVTGTGLDILPAIAAFFSIDHRSGFQGGFNAFGTDTDKG